MTTRPIAEQLLLALRDHGAREIFGIPGDFALPFFKVIEESRVLPLYTLSHEPGIGFAADASSRFRSGLGVAAVTYGAGALNMVNPTAAAFAEKSAVAVISSRPGLAESRSGLLLHHQARTLDSQFQVYREVTCAQARLDDPRTAPAEIARVLRACLTYSRPVYIEVPRDMVTVPCEAVIPAPKPSANGDSLSACVDEVLARLDRATRPVVLVGVEIRRFGLEAAVAEFIDRLGAPVATSLLGRGLLAGCDVPFVGTYLGVAGDPEVTELVEGSDALLLLGVIVSDTNFGVSARQIDRRKAIQALDGQVTVNFHTYHDIPLTDFVQALRQRIADRPLSAKPRRKPTYPHNMPADDQPIAPLDIATAINDLSAEMGRFPISADAGDSLFTGLDIEPTEFAAPGYYATMGFAVPAGLGLQVASGRRPIVLVGDGAFQMTGMELGHCRRYGWDPIVLVLNNASWEMLRAFQPESQFNSLDTWDFAALAGALGGEGVHVRTRAELASALRQAAGRRGRFQLLDIHIPRGALSPTLARFVAEVRRGRGQI